MSTPSSPSHSVVALPSSSDPEWQPILHSSNQIVLYNAKSHALTISRSVNEPSTSSMVATKAKNRTCPYCKQTMPPGIENELYGDEFAHESDVEPEDEEVESILRDDPAYHSRAPNYFQLLAISNDVNSRPASPKPLSETEYESRTSTFPVETMAEGYFSRFFQEEYKLGMGANGSVFLCQHVLDGNPLGHFAVKKIAVGESHSYLLSILREVRLLETLHHPNIITYHHAWLETCQFSAFGPRVPTLHVLMQWAEGGSLDDFIDVRLGRKTNHPHIHVVPNGGIGLVDSDEHTPTSSPRPDSGMQSRSARIRAFRAYQKATPEERERMTKEGFGRPDLPSQRKSGKEWTPVHLLSADEVKSLFQDVVEGLGFLHNKSILHLDLKPGNVLLTWDDGRMIPRAMLSDFGTSRDMINSSQNQRSGNTGTLEYASPESLPSPDTGLLGQMDSKSDMWSLGMILHKMLFFKLPYRYAAEGDANGEPTSLGSSQESEKMARLEREVLEYSGFKGTPELAAAFETRRLPRSFLVLLESLLHRNPSVRPSCDRVKTAIREGKFDPLRPVPQRNGRGSPDALVPIHRGARSSSRAPEDVPSSGPPLTQKRSSVETPQRLLELPSPPLSPPASSTLRSEKVSLPMSSQWLRQEIERNQLLTLAGTLAKSPGGRAGLRIVRSLILVSKVLSIPQLCPDVHDQPRPWILALLFTMGVVDTALEVEPWYHGLLVTLGLAALHMNVIGYGAGMRAFCVRS